MKVPSLIFLTAMLPAAALAAQPSPQMLAQACTGCHGTYGSRVGASIPSLAGQSRACLATALQSFRSGARPSTVMGRLARGYSEAEILVLAEYFAQQTGTTTQARECLDQ